MGDKTCFKCGEIKPRSEYYRHPQMADGLLGKCKQCTKRDVKERYQVAIKDRHAYERRRNQEPKRKADSRKHSEHMRRKWPEKYKARTAVNNAVRDRRIMKEPCSRCGAKEQVEGHHHDYSRPLDVTWLCFKCHREDHGQRAEPIEGDAS